MQQNGWTSSCLQVYSCLGCGHILLQKYRETEALSRGQQLRAQREMGFPVLAPALGLQSLSFSTFKMRTATVLLVRVPSGPASRQACGARPRGAASQFHPGSRAFSFGLLGGTGGKWFVVC